MTDSVDLVKILRVWAPLQGYENLTQMLSGSLSTEAYLAKIKERIILDMADERKSFDEAKIKLQQTKASVKDKHHESNDFSVKMATLDVEMLERFLERDKEKLGKIAELEKLAS